MGKVIHWELWKKFKFDLTNKYNKHIPESFQENETHNIRWGFYIQTNHRISARRPALAIVNEKKY